MYDNQGMSMGKKLSLEGADSYEEDAVFSIEDDDRLCVAVAEEQAVDSYNQMFTCRIHLSRNQMRTLRDWLSTMLENG